jgi:hypothetical protein
MMYRSPADAAADYHRANEDWVRTRCAPKSFRRQADALLAEARGELVVALLRAGERRVEYRGCSYALTPAGDLITEMTAPTGA